MCVCVCIPLFCYNPQKGSSNTEICPPFFSTVKGKTHSMIHDFIQPILTEKMFINEEHPKQKESICGFMEAIDGEVMRNSRSGP